MVMLYVIGENNVDQNSHNFNVPNSRVDYYRESSRGCVREGLSVSENSIF